MKIALLGDIALIGKYDLTINNNAMSSLEKISKKLEQYDYVIGNLESPLTDETRTMVCKSMHLKSPVLNLELLKYLNIDAVSLANNHSYDYGRKGIEDTINLLKKNKIDFFGIDGKSILLENISLSGFCCYSTNAFGYNNDSSQKGVNALTYKEVFKQVKLDQKMNKLSLLSLHWGDEHTNYPRYDHIKFARYLSKHNNIVISGHHPHVIQGVEQIDNSVIAYSQGNFCFDDCIAISGTGMNLKQNEENRESFILDVETHGSKVKNYECIGIREVEGEIILDSVDQKLSYISLVLQKIDDECEYQNMRVAQFLNPEFRINKFGKKNIIWFLKRLNYYALGSFLTAKFNAKKYKQFFLSGL